MNDATKVIATKWEKLRNILLAIGAIIVVLTDIISMIELFKIEHLLSK